MNTGHKLTIAGTLTLIGGWSIAWFVHLGPEHWWSVPAVLTSIAVMVIGITMAFSELA